MDQSKNKGSKAQSSINLRLILICFFFLFILFLILRSSSFSPSAKILSVIPTIQPSNNSCPPPPLVPSCSKLPPSLSHALVFYATLNITPQQTFQEISVTSRVLEKKSPCNFLVFGLGYDSLMWASLNHGGRTVFLEEDKQWIQNMKQQFPELESYHVTYDTNVTQFEELMKVGMEDPNCKKVKDPRSSECRLAQKNLPAEIYDVEWDLIMVDAPTGWRPIAPGRMTAIYTAGLMARNRESGETDVFVHDVNRKIEHGFSMAFLCEGYMKEEAGILRHFTVPSHRTRKGRPFCP